MFYFIYTSQVHDLVLKFIYFCEGVIKNDHPQSSDSNFENDVQSWFRTAKTRFDREK